MIELKHYKALFVGAIISCALSMYFGYQFGQQDTVNAQGRYVHLVTQDRAREIYVTRDTSTHLMWINDTLYFLPK